MAASEEKPLVEHDEDFNEHEGTSWCGCFRVFGLKWGESHGDEGKGLLQQKKGEDGWVINKLKKMKEVSEVIAGPKWKTFIRKVSGYGRKQKNRFQYDEQSYALNFNSGAQSEEDETMPPSFSARFAAPFAAPRRQSEL